MKHSLPRNRRRREAGIALVTALMITLITATLLAASLCVSMTSNELGWNQARAEAALQVADAGVNWELQYIAENAGQTTLSLLSSQPVASVGVTLKFPGENFPVKGANGTVPGYSNGQFFVYASNDAAGTTAWDGVTSPYYITSSGYVNGAWNRVQITSTASSVFNINASAALGSYGTSPTTVTVTGSGSSVVVSGSAAINGTVSTASGSSFTAPTAINSNTCTYSSGQFTSSNVTTGGSLCSNQAPVVYPTCASCIRKICGQPSLTDTQAYTWRSNNCSNSTGVYTYNNWTNSTTINTHNCTQVSGGCGTTLNNACWNNANTCPGTYNSGGYWWGWNWQPQSYAVQTLIFEPGDYYFTSAQLAYNCTCQLICDPQGAASGCTPGQVRFWLCPGSNPTSDSISLPIDCTCSNGSVYSCAGTAQQSNTTTDCTKCDCGQCRIYDCKDNCSCQFNRPSGCTDCWSNSISSDFNYCCGVYASTRQPDTTVSTTGGCQTNTVTTTNKGCTVSLCGCDTHRSHGCCKITGSCLCDKLSCQNSCTLNFQASSTCTTDPCCGGQCASWCQK